MKETKRCICNFSFYDQQAIEERLEDMARRGWMLEKTGSFTWTYRRGSPKQLRFCVTYFPAASEFDPGPTEGELTKQDYCRQDGWELVARWGVMQIFSSENPDAVPIETEPVTQVENLRRSMRKNVLLPQAVLCGMLLWNLFLRFSRWRRDPIGELSDPASLYSTFMFAVLTLDCLYEIGFYFHWTRKARRAAEEDGVFLPVRSKPVVSWILIALSALLVLLSYSSQKLPVGLALFLLCGIPAITVIGNFLKRWLRKRGASRNVNRAVSMGAVLLLTFLLLGLMTAAILRGGLRMGSEHTVVGTYELYGRTREVCGDPLPLEIEALADVNARWSKEADHQETFLLSSTEYRQHSIPADGNDVPDNHELEYTVADVRWDFLYDFVKEAVLNSRQDKVHDDFVFTDHYEPVDPAPWGLDSAYQLHWGNDVLNGYLFFKGNRMVELTFYWEPTPEQLEKAARALFGD